MTAYPKKLSTVGADPEMVLMPSAHPELSRALSAQAEALRALSAHPEALQELGENVAPLRMAQGAHIRMLRTALREHPKPLSGLLDEEIAASPQELIEYTEALRGLHSELVAQALNVQDGAVATGSMPVSIYLADEDIHEQVETAVEQWLTTADVSIDTRREPVIGSWFRQMAASLKRAVKTPAAREAPLTATHAADSHLVQAQDAYVTATLLQNVGPVLQALQPTKDAVVRAGALLIAKVDWVVQVYQLTAAQQAILDHQPHLAASPKEIITALESPDLASQEAAYQSEAPQLSTGTTAARAAK